MRANKYAEGRRKAPPKEFNLDKICKAVKIPANPEIEKCNEKLKSTATCLNLCYQTI